MEFAPLSLALEPILPVRAPRSEESSIAYGFRLRLLGGPALADDDPLLAAYGARVLPLAGLRHHDEAAQDAAFDPGRPLRLLREPDSPHDPHAVGVWDADGLRQAGYVPAHAAPRVAAALDHGLELHARALTEWRVLDDDRRTALQLLIAPAAFVGVEAPAPAPARPARRPARRRLVLLADGSAPVRWWDPSGAAGPLALAELPVSPELGAALHRLAEDWERAADVDPATDPFEDLEQRFAREHLETEARRVWQRARSELGRRFAIGYLGPGMDRPVWRTDELSTTGDDDLPF